MNEYKVFHKDLTVTYVIIIIYRQYPYVDIIIHFKQLLLKASLNTGPQQHDSISTVLKGAKQGDLRTQFSQGSVLTQR